jgi:hypothetical protein
MSSAQYFRVNSRGPVTHSLCTSCWFLFPLSKSQKLTALIIAICCRGKESHNRLMFKRIRGESKVLTLVNKNAVTQWLIHASTGRLRRSPYFSLIIFIPLPTPKTRNVHPWYATTIDAPPTDMSTVYTVCQQCTLF